MSFVKNFATFVVNKKYYRRGLRAKSLVQSIIPPRRKPVTSVFWNNLAQLKLNKRLNHKEHTEFTKIK